jgi:hypothetical protein
LISEGAVAANQMQDREILITGETTPLARERTQELGWTVTEKFK